MKKLVAAIVGVIAVIGVTGGSAEAASTDSQVTRDHSVEIRETSTDPRWRTANAHTSVEELNKLPREGTPVIPPPTCSSTACSNTAFLTHLYSFSTDIDGAGSMTGMFTRRNENVSVAHSGPNNCGGPIYRTTWMEINTGGWIEMGTAHWCDGTRSWFGYTKYAGGNEAWLYNIPITGFTSHTHSIVRDFNNHNWWAFLIDGTPIYSLNYGSVGIGMHVRHGLESYSSWATVQGPGTRQTENYVLLWNGLPGGYWWAHWTANDGYSDVQMYHRLISTQPGMWNEVALCQNWPAASCG